MFLRYYRVFRDTFFVLDKVTVLGYIIFAPDGHVVSLAVAQGYRRKGIGTALINTCESCCRGDRLLVEVREGNMGARRFYRKLGFRLKARIRLYYGTEDAFVMEKRIHPALCVQ
jgi:ribosomal-protein-alanine N-acetyltransferase